MAVRYALLSIGDVYADQPQKDEAAQALESICARLGWELVERGAIPSDLEAVSGWLSQTADSESVNLILTLDGAGIKPTDVTPEATYQVLEKYVTGLVEMLRIKLIDQFPALVTFRGVAGIRGKTLILNLPGTPLQAKQALDVLKNVLRQAVEQLNGS